MNKNGMIGEMLETGQSTIKNAAKQTVTDVAQSAKSQITGSSASDQGTNEAGNAAQKQMSDDQAQQFLKDLYGKSDKPAAADKTSGNSSQNKTSHNQASPLKQAFGVTPADPNAGKSPEELVKLEALRKQLHSDYYQNLINPPKANEEAVADKIEREDQEQKFSDLETQKKKPPPIVNPTMKQGTGENVVGISG